MYECDDEFCYSHYWSYYHCTARDCLLFIIRYIILPAAVGYAENLVALSCGGLKSMSGPMATVP